MHVLDLLLKVQPTVNKGHNSVSYRLCQVQAGRKAAKDSRPGLRVTEDLEDAMQLDKLDNVEQSPPERIRKLASSLVLSCADLLEDNGMIYCVACHQPRACCRGTNSEEGSDEGEEGEEDEKGKYDEVDEFMANDQDQGSAISDSKDGSKSCLDPEEEWWETPLGGTPEGQGSSLHHANPPCALGRVLRRISKAAPASLPVNCIVTREGGEQAETFRDRLALYVLVLSQRSNHHIHCLDLYFSI
ncbi:MAG: hypothetical protein M1818_001541 [Claussenomyces sp. TS43310]|nr:MAG: hypothetical protein M1818_001541 [Claussenomyces sp. TS43310]